MWLGPTVQCCGRGVGNEQFWRTRFPDFSLISPWFPSKMTSYVVKVGGAGGLGWFPSLISRKSALISHDFNLISADFSTRCTRFLSSPTPRLWDKAHTLCSPDSPVFHGRGWLTRLNMTCTLWKQARLTIPKDCEVASDVAQVSKRLAHSWSRRIDRTYLIVA